LPTYARVLAQQGAEEARLFSGRVLTLLLLSQVVLLALALAFTPRLVGWLAPGFEAAGGNFDLAVTLTRITFPYLLFVTLATLQSSTQNAHGHFAAAAFAPVLLNLFIILFLFASHAFASAAVAASWGVVVSGAAQLVLLTVFSWRYGLLEVPTVPRLDRAVKVFFVALGPAVIGSAGQQVAILADTILASLLPPGSVSSIYYADRLYQLPLGIIGVAAVQAAT
jgi:putative peptidoglycan lipid II flippase